MGEMMAIKSAYILSLNYYTYGQPFSGSYEGMRYRVERQFDKDEQGKDTGDPYFAAAVWPEPFCYEVTDQEKIERKRFPFSEEGKDQLIAWLNEKYEKELQ